MGPPDITPMQPIADGALPWDQLSADPVAELASARAECGDTFVVDSGDDRYLFLFSAEGVRSLYRLPEESASKGMADWRMLRRKLPDELFLNRRTLPYDLFGRDDVQAQLANLDVALAASVDELGTDGTFEAFAWARRLAHRMGLASWGGPGSATGDRFDSLVTALDALDASDAFVRPDLMADVAANGQADELAALDRVTQLIGESLAQFDRDRAGSGSTQGGAEAPSGDLFAQMVAKWDGEAEPVRGAGVAGDVVLVHLASMSNLFAALGWAVVDLLDRPELAQRVVDGDRVLAEHCALESIRLAQRSIMMRYVLAPTELEVSPGEVLAVEPGITLATLLPLTNASAAPGLDRWDPQRWAGRRLGPHVGLDTVELVTTFGYGPHTCPAQPFSLAAITRTVARLFGTYRMTPEFESARPLPVQIGGVGRAADPCPVLYWT